MTELERLRLEVNRLTRENERLHGEAERRALQLEHYRARDAILTRGNDNLSNILCAIRESRDSETLPQILDALRKANKLHG